MGWERKRGKIEEFNRLLRGATDTSFTCTSATSVDPARGALLHHARQRHAAAARRRARADRHHHAPAQPPGVRPAGRPRHRGLRHPAAARQRDVSSAAGSLFARLYAGHTGVDPYTTAVSDTYQDLFGEGIFTGKGLYDVDAFMAALEGRVPENALLSHDLFEGVHARVALVSDVELVDDYPSSVLAHARRQHRWIRGDWQILAWLLPFVPSRAGLQRNRCRSSALEDPRQPAAQPAGAAHGSISSRWPRARRLPWLASSSSRSCVRGPSSRPCPCWRCGPSLRWSRTG
jgi:cyclic beta-1,2-glucan synthetase